MLVKSFDLWCLPSGFGTRILKRNCGKKYQTDQRKSKLVRKWMRNFLSFFFFFFFSERFLGNDGYKKHAYFYSSWKNFLMTLKLKFSPLFLYVKFPWLFVKIVVLSSKVFMVYFVILYVKQNAKPSLKIEYALDFHLNIEVLIFHSVRIILN